MLLPVSKVASTEEVCTDGDGALQLVSKVLPLEQLTKAVGSAASQAGEVGDFAFEWCGFPHLCPL